MQSRSGFYMFFYLHTHTDFTRLLHEMSRRVGLLKTIKNY